MIRGIILAAGEARRMGRLKQLLPFGTQPLICHVAQAACQSKLDEVVVVVGANEDLVAEALGNFPLKIISNPAWSEGQATSLIAGLQDLALGTEAVLFLLADQPLITPGLINRLLAAWRDSDKTIVCPTHGKRRGNPVLFDLNKWQTALSTLRGDQGARQIITDHPEQVGLVAVDSEQVFWDIDTEEDYRRILDLFTKQ